MRAVVEFVRRHPFAVAGIVALAGLLVAGLIYSDPPTSDDRNRPRLPPVKDQVSPSENPPVPSPVPRPTTTGPTTPTPMPSAPTSAPEFSFTPGPFDPSDLAVAPQP